MGMFDRLYVYCDLPGVDWDTLDKNEDGTEDRSFQTKSLGCTLSSYVITEDRILKTGIFGEKVNFNGVLHFYGKAGTFNVLMVGGYTVMIEQVRR